MPPGDTAMKAVIWPANLDAQKSRSKGRKISLKSAVPSPTLGEITEAAAGLGLGPIAEEEKSYPREWWEKSGRVTVEKKIPKTRILTEVAAEIKRKRK